MLRRNSGQREWLIGPDIRRIGMTHVDTEKMKVKLWLTLPLVIAISDCMIRLFLN